MNNNTLVLDIETKTFNNEVNPDKDIFRLAGYYIYDEDKKGITTNTREIQRLVDNAKYIVTFNGKYYDIPILERHGINFKYKIQLDLKEIIKKRAGIIKIPEGRLKALPGTNCCVNCSTTGIKKAIVTTGGNGDHTWNDIEIVTEKQYESHLKTYYCKLDKIMD